MRLCELLSLNVAPREAAGVLDQYCVSGRYPDALPSGAPFEVFTRKQAAEPIRLASGLLRRAAALHPHPPRRKRRRT